jgi:hypothetical protein
MIQLATPEPPLELNEQKGALSASDFAHLRRALLWLVILFVVTAATSLVINVPTPLFAGMQCYLSWCAIAALIQYFFLRIRGSALSDHDSDRSITLRRQDKPSDARGRDQSIASSPRLAAFAGDGQWVIFFAGVTAMALSFRATVGTAGLPLCGFVFIAAAIVFSRVGLIPPVAAAFVHEFGAFFVIFNSARLLRFEGKSA